MRVFFHNCSVVVFRCPFIGSLNSLSISLLGKYFRQLCVGKVLLYPCFLIDFQLIARSAMRRSSRGLTNATDTEYTIVLPTFLDSCYYWMLISEYETQWLLSGTYSHLSEATATSEQLRYATHSQTWGFTTLVSSLTTRRIASLSISIKTISSPLRSLKRLKRPSSFIISLLLVVSGAEQLPPVSALTIGSTGPLSTWERSK